MSSRTQNKRLISIESIHFMEVVFNSRILYFSNTEVSRFKMFDRIPFRRTLKRPQVMVPPFFGRRFRSEPETVGPSHQGFDNPIYGNTPIDASIFFFIPNSDLYILSNFDEHNSGVYYASLWCCY